MCIVFVTKHQTPLMYKILDKITIKNEMMPHLSVKKHASLFCAAFLRHFQSVMSY